MSYLAPPGSIHELRNLHESHVDGPGENLTQTATVGVSLDQNEAEFFAAVKDSDIDLVKSKLNDTNNPVNINAINSDGETALQIAAENSNFDIMKELLAKGADLKNALLQCIIKNDLECVEVLLSNKPDDKEISEDGYITPTSLAAQLDRYEIVHFFIQNNYLIKEPPDWECICSEECEQKSHMLRSQIAINRFRGLSSPVYMCLGYLVGNEKDPLTQAFDLNTKVQTRASDEPELKKEYLKLSERCKTFATDLYNGCRSMKEITALLDIGKNQSDLSSGRKLNIDSREVVTKLRTAINSDHKEFIAHPHTQQLLNALVYCAESKKIYRISSFSSILVFILFTILFPLLVLLFFVNPKNRVSRMMIIPYFKFISHLSQFIIFLILIAASALRDNHTLTGLEYLIFITVVGMIVQEFIEMLHHRPRISYFFKWWNIVTTIMLTLFVLAALSWIAGFAITGGWSVVNYSLSQFAENKDGYQLLLLGNSFFSLAIVVSVFHLVDLCQVNSVLGPLQLSLYRMLQDVLKFFLFFAAIFVAFVMGLRNLYSYYNSVQAAIAEHSNKNNSMVAEINHPFSTFSQSTQSMFWAFFDNIDLKDFDTKDGTFDITQETAKVLFAFYSICAIMVALNMLIAMMSHSFEYISQDDDIQWKFSRTQLWLEFIEKGSTLPAPYNLLPNPREIYRFFKKLKGNSYEFSTTNQTNGWKDQAERKTIIKRLVRRYFLTRESQRKKELRTVKDIEESEREIIKILKENHAANATV